MKCRICGGESIERFSAVVLEKYTVRYFLCNTCLFLQTEEPYWLQEAYLNPIRSTDTGMVARSIYFSKIVTALICLEFDKNGAFLDFGGGYGLFTRLMRDVGFDYYWIDPFTQNLLARGFEYSDGMRRVDLVTAFESFEHFADPMQEIKTMVEYSPNIFFSTETLPVPPPQPGQWYYYAPYHGQHISFYSLRTFHTIAEKFGLNYYSNGSDLHFLTKKNLSRSRFRFIMRYGKYLYLVLKKQLHSRTADDVGRTGNPQ